jgi:hypothetical protein
MPLATIASEAADSVRPITEGMIPQLAMAVVVVVVVEEVVVAPVVKLVLAEAV